MAISAATRLSQDAKSITHVPLAHPFFLRAAAKTDDTPCAVVFLDLDDTLSFHKTIPRNEIAFNNELLQASTEHFDVIFWSQEQREFLHPPQTFNPNLNIVKFRKRELQNLVLTSEQNHVDLYILTASPIGRKPFIKLFFDAVFRNTSIRHPFTDDRILCVITDEYFAMEKKIERQIESSQQRQFKLQQVCMRTIGKALACMTMKPAYSNLPSNAFVFVDDQKCNIDFVREHAGIPAYKVNDDRALFPFLQDFIKYHARETMSASTPLQYRRR